jgi:hypothetical protein
MLTDGLQFIHGAQNHNMVIPNITEQQKTELEKPSIGSIVYQTDGVPGIYVHNGSQWMLGIYTSYINDILDVKSLPVFSGDVTSTKGTANLVLIKSGVEPGRYNNVYVDDKGRIYKGENIDYDAIIDELRQEIQVLKTHLGL